MIGIGLWALVVAHAQEGGPSTDLHGDTPPLGDGSAASAVTVRGAPRLARGAWRAGVLLEGAASPATLYVVDGGDTRSEVLLGDLIGANLGGSYAFGRRLGVEAMLPVFRIGPEERLSGEVEGATGGLGDAQLRLPIGIVAPEDGEGLALGLTPYAVLPTGRRDLQLGSGGGAGTWALVGHRTDRVSADLAAAVSWVRTTGTSQQLGGLQLPVGGAISVRPAGRIWVGAEARVRFDPGSTPSVSDVSAVPSGVGRVGEALLSIRGDLGGRGMGLWSGGAAGTALGSGPGSSPFRAFLGASIGDDGRPDEEASPQGVATGPVVLQVTEADGTPVAGAQVLADGEEVARTGVGGRATVDGERLWPSAVQVVVGDRAPVDVPAPADAAAPVVVALAAEPRAVDLRVSDLEGAPVVGSWTATSVDGDVLEGKLGPRAAMALPPGEWEVVLASPGRGEQVRAVVVEPLGTAPRIEAVMAPEAGGGVVSFAAVDAAGVGLGGARVLLDGLPVGTTSSGGTVRLDGLAEGDHQLVVEKVGYTSVERTVSTGVELEPLVLAPVPGTVRVRVRGPDDAPATDAVVRFLGPSRLPAVPVDGAGERVQVLGPGDWSLVVTSPTLGGQARTLRIDEDQTGVQVLDVGLRPSEGGLADLEVAVVDLDGRPVDGVEVILGGFSLGSTGSGGRIRIDELALGERTLEVRSDLLGPVAPVELALVEGPQELVVPVRFRAGAVQVRGVGPDGAATDASLRLLAADGTSRELSLGDDGVERFVLEPGTWSLFATAIHGAQSRELEVRPADASLKRVDLVFRPSEGGLADLVVRAVGPEGGAVPDATVRLDGFNLGTTGGDGSLRIEELAVGARELVVDGPLHAPTSRRVRLSEGELEVEETLEWAEGATRFQVRDAAGPVDDAIVRVLGPTSIPMGPVDAAGQRTVLLAPGAWQVLASSPSRGVGLLSFPVPEQASDLLLIDVPVEPVEGELADLVLRVVDGDGTPVVGATVELDGTGVGETGQGGVLKVDELRPATFRTVVRHPDHPPTTTDVVLPPGVTDRIVPMAWALRPVQVTVQNDEGQPVQAEVQWRGPADMEPSPADSRGVATAMLRPGSWQALVAGGELGPGRVDFEVSDAPVDLVLVLGRSQVEVSAAGIAITEQVLFDFDAATLRAAANPVLDQVASALLAGSSVVRVEVQGHSDATGDPAYNQQLSEARARAVLEALVKRGVPQELLSARGYGPQRPVADNATPEGRSQNRRVQFEVQERGVE